MNVIFLSPHFPPNFRFFCAALRRCGARVLGIGDTSYDALHPELRAALTEFYRVERLEDYDQVLRAAGYFTHKYGKIDRVDSHNEHWLETEARLRTDFNVSGIGMGTIGAVKFKSRMKARFASARVPSARGDLVSDRDSARRVIDLVGFPVVAKPDKGVGAAGTTKISDEAELAHFLEEKLPIEYFVEEFVPGQIESFDGLTDRTGTPVFFTAHTYTEGIMDVVNKDKHIAYYSFRELPRDLLEAGMNLLRVYDVRERFFHFEFIRHRDSGLLHALEVNMRPPGGPTMDMFNYANDLDLYQEWANVVVRNEFAARWEGRRPYHCAFIGRKNSIRYKHTHEQLLTHLGDKFMAFQELPRAFSRAMGDTCYLIRHPELGAIHEAIAYGHAPA